MKLCAASVPVVAGENDVVCILPEGQDMVRLSWGEADTLAHAAEMRTTVEHASALYESDVLGIVSRIATLCHIKYPVVEYVARILRRSGSGESLWRYGPLYEQRINDIRKLQSKGLLVSDDELLSRTETLGCEPEPRARIRAVCIPTARRPQRLARCIETFARNCEMNSRNDAAIVVMEDSDEPMYREMVTRVQAKSNVEIRHYTLRDREEMATRLSKHTAVSPDVIGFAICQPKILGNSEPARNAFTLVTKGRHVLFADDDTSCAYYHMVGPLRTILTALPTDCYESRFYSSHEHIRQACDLDCDVDIFSRHEELLGRSVSSILNQAETLMWSGPMPEIVSSLQAGDGHIGITSTGCLGDSGLYGSGSYIFAATDEILARMAENETSYKCALHSGKVLRAAIAQVLTRGSYFQSMSYAADNTRVLPPYFSLGRNADSVFALLYLRTNSRSWIAHLPLAIYHESEPDRDAYHVQHTQEFSRIRLGDIVKYAIDADASYPPALDRSLSSIGGHLVDLARASTKGFQSFVCREFLRRQALDISLLERRLSTLGSKLPLWATDVEQMLRNMRYSLTDRLSVVPVDLEKEVGTTSCMEVAQRYVGLYGRLLCAWEELVAEAGQILQS